jgi:hypothetical protein
MRFSKIEARNSENNVQQDFISFFELVDLCPGCALLVNISYSIISLLPVGQSGYVIAQRILTEAEMRVLLPLLDSPTCCQQAVLQASYYCKYELLVKVLMSPDVSTTKKWNELVQEQRDRLHLAQQKKTTRTEMRGVYNALFGLRQKLEPLGLTIRSKRNGYYLCKAGV